MLHPEVRLNGMAERHSSARMPELAGVRHREVPLGGVTLHVAELGSEDAPPLLLAHGWPQNWWCWSRVAPLLEADFRCLMPDFRGHGWSTAPSGGYEKEQLADDLLRLLDALRIERVGYVGHDWGAFVGFLIGITKPERLSKLLALSIPHLWPSTVDRINPLQALAFSYQIPLSLPFVGHQLMRRGLTRAILRAASAAFTDRDLEVYASTMDSPEGAKATTALYRSFLLKELPAIALGRYQAQRLEIPTRLIVGGRDPITRPNSLAGYRSQAPLMEVERVPSAGHFLPQEEPRLIAQRAKALFAPAST